MRVLERICEKYGVKTPPEIIGRAGEKSGHILSYMKNLKPETYQERIKVYELEDTLRKISSENISEYLQDKIIWLEAAKEYCKSIYDEVFRNPPEEYNDPVYELVDIKPFGFDTLHELILTSLSECKNELDSDNKIPIGSHYPEEWREFCSEYYRNHKDELNKLEDGRPITQVVLKKLKEEYPTADRYPSESHIRRNWLKLTS